MAECILTPGVASGFARQGEAPDGVPDPGEEARPPQGRQIAEGM